jgi:uncharacterized repeat protein (TIGR03806 family)
MRKLVIVCFLSIVACKQNSPAESETIVAEEVVWEAPAVDLAQVDFSQIPFKNLSEYGFFLGQMKKMIPAEGVLLYEPSSSLFTDYAHKSRFIWMPKGNPAQLLDDVEGSMDFPDKTILIKNFYYPADFNKPSENRRILETRLLIKRNGTWDAFPYVWKDDQTDAIYKVVGAEIPVKWTDEAGNEQVINYIVPNKNQCKNCHNKQETMVPIGVKAKYLNHAIIFAEGEKNQLLKWQEAGYLSGPTDIALLPSMVDYRDENHSLDLRAMAYLDINCGHCHRAEGPASTSGLFLTYEEKDPLRLGINKAPVAAGTGAGSFKYDIVPGHSDQSILTYRMSTNKVGAAMPEIGRVTVHEEGLRLIREWIDGMGKAPDN